MNAQHIAAQTSSLEILRYFLLHGASVHLRNNAGRTPLFLAANAGLSDHVVLLRKSGAHLHAEERALAEIQARRRPGVWALAGVGTRSLKERHEVEGRDDRSGENNSMQAMAGSAPG